MRTCRTKWASVVQVALPLRVGGRAPQPSPGGRKWRGGTNRVMATRRVGGVQLLRVEECTNLRVMGDALVHGPWGHACVRRVCRRSEVL